MPAYRLQQNEFQIAPLQEKQELLEQLGKELEPYVEIPLPYRNKVKVFLADTGIRHITEIDYGVRAAYEDYLVGKISPNVKNQYIRALDRIKRHFVREQMGTLKGK